MITLGKKKTLHSKRNLFSKLQDKSSVDKLEKILSERYLKRPGGYSRVIKAGFRYGDDAPMAVIELIDRDREAKKVDIIKKTPEKKDTKLDLESKKIEKTKKTLK